MQFTLLRTVPPLDNDPAPTFDNQAKAGLNKPSTKARIPTVGLFPGGVGLEQRHGTVSQPVKQADQVGEHGFNIQGRAGKEV